MSLIIACTKELMVLARDSLRCIDWRNLDFGLLSTGSQADKRDNAYYELSRPVEPRESIDYFVSHSWYPHLALPGFLTSYSYNDRQRDPNLKEI